MYHSRGKALSFFAGLTPAGIGGPTFVAMSTELGPKIFQPGQKIDPALMRESWFVVWFAGATNWLEWDSPQLLTLQRRPSSILFDTNGLHFTFATNAGYAALMPLYGYYKPAQLAYQPLPIYDAVEKKKRVLTWEWYKALPADPLARARYWASVLREFPIFCEDSFSLDTESDRLNVRQSFRWLSWEDDWKTKHWKLAPLSPVLALAYKEGLPAEFSKKPFDMEIFTTYGPYYGVENVDSYELTLPLLGYVNTTAGVGDSATGWTNAACFNAWRQAHADGSWEPLRARWPELRSSFERVGSASWTAFAALGISPLEQAANALGAARIGYRLGDMDAYATACNRFARAFTQLYAQRRGVQYFRGRQPWHSSSPIEEGARLETIGADGWQIRSQPEPAANPDPDLARLVRDTRSSSQESATAQRKLERLIPGHGGTQFIAVPDAPAAGGANLVGELETRSFSNAFLPAWPHRIWKEWKTPVGTPWSFGHVTLSTNQPARATTMRLNWNTTITTYSTH